MNFSSLEFLFWFLPFFLAVYYLVPPKLRNGAMLFFSLAFYGYGSWSHPEQLLFLLCSVGVNYCLGLLLSLTQQKKAVLTLSVLGNLTFLFLCKYLDFFRSLFRLPPLGGALPLGISFFTFQIVAYLVDVYRGKIPAERSLLRFSTAILMFPKLTSGPIADSARLFPQLAARRYRSKPFLDGLRLFLIGMSFKVLLADQLGGLWREVNGIGYSSISTPLAWLALFGFSFQLYFDFYGYSLMAMGLGRMAGIFLPRNFNHPYCACTMTDFWRRWHITLGAWFREYVYIPLGGNRQGKAKTYRNLLAVWLLTGLWHGAGWNYLLWGLSLFCIIAAEKAGLGKVLERRRVLGHLYMLLLIPLTWLIFAMPDLSSFGLYLGRLFGFGGEQIFAGDFAKYWGIYGKFLIPALILSTPLPAHLFDLVKERWYIWPPLLALFAACVYCTYRGMNDPFFYFRF